MQTKIAEYTEERDQSIREATTIWEIRVSRLLDYNGTVGSKAMIAQQSQYSILENGPASRAREVCSHTDIRCLLSFFFVLLTPFRIPKDVNQQVIACRGVRALASKKALCRPRFGSRHKLKPKTFQVTTVSR